MNFIRLRRSARPAFFALGAAFLFLLSYFKVFEPYELATYDWRCRWRGPRPVSEKIVLIDIADDTLENIGAWPFSRDYHAALIDVLKTNGAKAVLFDIVFIETHPDEDAEVAQAANDAGNVYFAYAFREPVRAPDGYTSDGWLAPLIEPYAKAAKGTGFINVIADVDGKRRRILPRIRFEGDDYFHIGFTVAADELGLTPDRLEAPLDENGHLMVNYAGTWQKTFRHYSYYEILYSQRQIYQNEKPIVNLSQFKDKICIIGHTATATHDANATPLEPIYPNVGIHANVLNSLLNADFIRRLGRGWNLLILLLLSLWAGGIAFHKSLLVSSSRALLTLLLFLVAAFCVFIQWGIWIDVFLPVVSVVVIYASATFVRTILEIQKRESIEKELKIASQIQKSFLAEKAPAHRGLDVAVYMKPAKEVGGDLYAFLKTDEETFGIMAGDVSGKGTPAALFMAKVVSEFKFSALDCTNPAEILLKLNDSIASESTGGLFVTLAYAIFDTKGRKLTVSNGGHLPIVAVKASGEAELLNVDEGMPIGVLPGVSFANLERPIAKGELFAFYSDGVTEARNKKKEEYSVEKLQRTLSHFRPLSAEQILQKIVEDLQKFMGKADQHDDITLIIAKISE